MEFWDEYQHDDHNLKYILENIKSDAVFQDFQEELVGCDCEEYCTENCSCLNKSGGIYKFEDKKKLSTYKIHLKDLVQPVYECNHNCKCSKFLCGNKLIQFGPRKNLQIYISSNGKGLGLKTVAEIEPGSFICEYVGEVLTETEARDRFEAYKRLNFKDNYIFCIQEHFGENNIKTFIDPTKYGNIGRYINHSCNPNCNLIPIRVTDLIPKLCIFAQSSIQKNEEITIDYGEESESQPIKLDLLKKCLCQSSNCRKFLPFDSTI